MQYAGRPRVSSENDILALLGEPQHGCSETSLVHFSFDHIQCHHGVTLAKKQCRLDIRKFSFSQRTVNEWNRLSADCVGASSVNIFKNKIDIYLRRAGYT